jgi:uncharacterized protein YukE
MSTRSFPALGFDPTPGELSAVGTVLESLQNAFSQMRECSTRLLDAVSITDDSEWGGSAAEEFSDHGDDLPQALNTGAESINAVGNALNSWAGTMAANQAKAEQLESKAKKLKEQLAEAGSQVDSAAGAIPRSTDNPNYDTAYANFLDAVSKEAKLREALEQVIEDAKRLQAKHEREADTTAEAIRSGPDDAFKPENDGFGVQLLDGISAVSGQVAMWSGTIAAVAAVVPGGQPVAVVLGTTAAAAGGVKGLSGLGQKAVGSRNAPSYGEIALDLVPTKIATSAARAGFTAARGARGSGAGAMAKGFGSGAKDGALRGAGDAPFVKVTRDVQDIRKRYGDTGGNLREALQNKASRDQLARGQDLAGDQAGRMSNKELRALAEAQARREAIAAGLGAPLDGIGTYEKIAGGDGKLPPELRAVREGAGYVVDPSGDRVEKILQNSSKEIAKNMGGAANDPFDEGFGKG